jgi:thermitase
MQTGHAWHLRVVLVALLCALVLVVVLPAASRAQDEGRPADGAEFAADELIVTFENEGVSGPTVSALSEDVEAAEDTETRVEPVAEDLGIQLFEFPEATSEPELADIKLELAQDPRVAAAEYNYKVEAFASPNDPLYPKQYYLPKVRAAEAYDVEQGSPETRIGVIDSGIQQTAAGTGRHPDLGAKVVAQHDFVGPGPGDPVAEDLDSVSHGTAVAGVAAAETNNDTGIAGVCPNCSVVVGKFSKSESGTVSDAIQAIQYAVEQDSDVLNFSYGTEKDIRALRRSINSAYAEGVTIVAAAGNSAWEGNPANYPAAYERVIAVGATNQNDRRASFSSFGKYVDITAPGVGILTTDADPPNTYSRLGGTSFSSPVVAGVAGLLADRNFNNVQIKRRIECTAKDLGPDGKDPEFGAGLVDAGAALTESCEAPQPPPEPDPKCDDGKDNDGDGKVDLNDPGCSSRNDDSERDKKPQPDRCTIRGTNGDNVLKGTPRSDRICGLGGNDVIRGLSGNDTLVGGAGRDQLLGSFGNDTLDSKDGVRGNDILDGDQGRDRFIKDRGDHVAQ